MAFSFFSKTQDESLVLLIDIGSGSVGGSLAELSRGKAPNILATVRHDIAFQNALSSARFLLAMNNALEETLKDLQEKIKDRGAPSHIFCTLSSPWFILRSRHLKVERETPFKVNNEVLNDFLNQDIVRLKEELSVTLPPKEVEVIEKKVIAMKLNGYELKNPYGQETKRMEIVVAMGVSSTRVVSSLKRKIGQFFHTKALHFGSFPLAAFSAIRDMFPRESNFLFLDITGEATDVSLVERDVLLGTASFARGKNFFIREISNSLGTVHEEAESLFNMHVRGELDGKKRDSLEEIVTRGRTEWLERFEGALATLAGEGTLPRVIFFSADADVSKFFAAMMQGAHSKFLLNNEFEPRFLDSLITMQFVSFASGVVRDPFLVVLALLAEKELSTGDLAAHTHDI